MEYEQDLGRLESVVTTLLAKVDAMRAEKHRLEGELRQLGQEKKALEDTIEQLNLERDRVRDRVVSLIATIEKWEQDQQPAAEAVGEGQEVGVAGQASGVV